MTWTIPVQEHSNELYSALPEEIRRRLTEADERKTVPTGAQLITHGTLPESLVILETGSVEVSLRAGRKTFRVATAGAGKVFGLREVMFEAPSEVDVICRNECTIRSLPAGAVREIVGSSPQACYAIAKVLSADLQMAESLLRRIPRRLRGKRSIPARQQEKPT